MAARTPWNWLKRWACGWGRRVGKGQGGGRRYPGEGGWCRFARSAAAANMRHDTSEVAGAAHACCFFWGGDGGGLMVGS